MKRYLRVFAVLGALALVLAACSPAETESTTTTAGPGTTQPPADTTTTGAPGTTAGPIGAGRMIGMAFDIGGRGDLSFNDLAALAWDDGMAMYGYTGEELSPDAGGTNREENLRLLAETGHELIVANGFAFAQNVWRVGTENPEVFFTITDSCPQDDTFATVEMDNVRCMLFAEEQGSFLVGAAAALKSTSGTIGFIGGVQIGLIEKFQAGFEAGARHVNPDINILPAVYLTQPPDFSGFSDSVKGKEAALALYNQGADVVYHAAGGAGLGLFQAAAEASTDDNFLWAIGVDADQYNTVGDPALQEHILTSMLKRVDVAVGLTIQEFLEGNFTPGAVIFDLSVDGVGYATTGGFVDDIADQLEELKAQIISGEITVPQTPGA
ncbi:MAG: BMP family ABC transporter substrate-binding protein [Actinobacteria bacterium]|nr:BMP family ABC transporter substrate-binding protein [Actinomycetota bacterium]MCI0544574.1 BMP family ABC transporter substrate-binding protein [Actinomycetota bacterium]MCI0677917.1 BMP family ABC transporter substrate-binding protein [Actinomycetota bacterium]